MRYAVPILFLVAGLTIGYLVGKELTTSNQHPLVATNQPERITEFIYDTVVERETIEVPVYIEPKDSSIFRKDTARFTEKLDTIQRVILPRDTIVDDLNVIIKRDRLIAAKEITINYLSDHVDKDTLIKELLGIKEIRPEKMLVEFWESPINFKGYKCSKHKMIIYGLSSQFVYELHKKNNLFYLVHDAVYYELQETNEFLNLKQVNSAILND